MGLQANVSMITRLQGLKGRALVETIHTIKYGRLYNWYAVNEAVEADDEGYSLAPEGWHVPTDAELTTLTDWIIANSDFTSVTVGNALKSCRQVDSPLGGDCDTTEHPRWDADAIRYGVDEYGFAALPGGMRIANGSFLVLGSYGGWWSSTENSSSYAWYRYMTPYDGDVYRTAHEKERGYSVRLIRDNDTNWVEGETVEIDGNTYNTVKIGDQVWMVQNLATTKYRNGTSIPHVTGTAAWGALTTPAYCNYDNDENWVFASYEWI